MCLYVVRAVRPKCSPRVASSIRKRHIDKKVEGVVRVAYDVTVDGTVENARVVESNPPGVFDAAALDAVRKWRFHPAVRNGKAVATQNMVSPVKFKLGESEAYARDHD